MPVHTFPLDGPINLQVRIGHGAVTVVAREDLTEARVELTSDSADPTELDQIVVVKQGPTLVVAAPRPGGIFDLGFLGPRRKSGVRAQVVVPSGTAVKISTVTATITVTGRVAGADVAFGSADASLDRVDGDLRLRFGTGTAQVRRVGGSVQVRSGSGGAPSSARSPAICVSGAAAASSRPAPRAERSPRLRSGWPRQGEVYGDVDLASGSGTMQIGLPAGVAARLDVTTGSGTVNTDLPIEDGPRRRGA